MATPADPPSIPPVRDPHRFINDLNPNDVHRLIERLESRGKEPAFIRLFENYASRLFLPKNASVLEMGSGTGVIARLLASTTGRQIHVTGIDQSPTLVEAAKQFTCDENLEDRLVFEVGDAHALQFEPGHFDAVIAHTVISHVTDPAAVLKEAYRVLKPAGTLVVFDGDYASLTYGYDDVEIGRSVDWALARTVFNNPVVMRHMSRLLEAVGFELTEILSELMSEVGQGSYFLSMADTYAPLMAESGLVPKTDIDAWISAQHQAIEEDRFFASCNYYSFIARRPG